jgi:hypothetical protein
LEHTTGEQRIVEAGEVTGCRNQSSASVQFVAQRPAEQLEHFVGSLLVVESGSGRLVCVDPSNGQLTTVAGGLETGTPAQLGTPPASAISSVVVGRNGMVFVSGDLGNVIYRVQPRHDH